ncbi:MAG: hypothetical protein H7A45_13175 [Verrucomicrobiales bacterium]|nr:hypothetical protein [Verrucomicrobiales bacterium]
MKPASVSSHRRHPAVRLRRVTLLVIATLSALAAEPASVLPGTQPLGFDGDPAVAMVAGIERYLDRLLALHNTRLVRSASDPESALTEDEQASRRERLRTLLGVVDEREPVGVSLVAPLSSGVAGGEPGLVGRGPGYRVFAVRWNVFRGVEGEGLLVLPDTGVPVADWIVVPDCDWSPEQVLGLAPGLPVERQFARRFAEAGCRLIIPVLIDRGSRFAGNPGVRSVKHSQRETLWRAGYEMGRTPLGYEIQKILAAADWLIANPATARATGDGDRAATTQKGPGIVGYGEGGLLAFHAGALDPRLAVVGVCGAYGLSARNPELPIYRNVWSLLPDFADPAVARLVAPRPLIVEHGAYPEVTHTDAGGGAPGRLWRPSRAEFQVAAKGARSVHAVFLDAGPDVVCGPETAERLLRAVRPDDEPGAAQGSVLTIAGGSTGNRYRTDPIARVVGKALGEEERDVSDGLPAPLKVAPENVGAPVNESERTLRQYRQLLEDTQWLMRESRHVRQAFWSAADRRDAAAFAESAAPYRDFFRTNVVGLIPPASLPPRPRTRLLYETNGYRGFEVILDVHPDILAEGILLVPTDLGRGERRPVVVCQHGLEGRPRDVADPRVENGAYHQYACQLAERGFVTFAPQNPYIGGTRFRQVLRKAQPLGLTLWSFIVRQHEVITEWLAAQDFVDPERIAFYGLSYGGKTAMRVPVLVDRYCLSICSADYNEWIWKNVSAREPYSYLWTIEYDMPEWNLGNTFNYAELSWLIFPRPFMVERGHDDGVAPDEWVAYEYARTRRHYVKLGLGDRTAIEFFDGPHSINGQGTFAFLHRRLNWPDPAR